MTCPHRFERLELAHGVEKQEGLSLGVSESEEILYTSRRLCERFLGVAVAFRGLVVSFDVFL